jgi:hypothetical protein
MKIMPSGIQSPSLVLAAVRHLYPELPAILSAAEWEEIRNPLDAAIATLASPGRASEYSVAIIEIVQLLAKYDVSRTMLSARLAAQDFVLSLVNDQPGGIKHIAAAEIDDTELFGTVLAAATIEIDKEAISATDTASDRGITLHQGGLGGAKSIKVRNFHFDFAELAKLASASLLSLQSTLANPAPLLIAASALMIIQSLVAAITQSIGEDEASVFWAFIQVVGNSKNKTATESELRATANRERKKFGLAPLKANEFTRALKRLESLSSIERSATGKSAWRLVESYHIRK